MRGVSCILLALLLLPGCVDSPTGIEKPDFRYGLYSTGKRYTHTDGVPLAFWTQEDGTRFFLTSGTLRCFEEQGFPDEVVFNWELRQPDGTAQVGDSDQWGMGEVECTLAGDNGLRFTLASNNENIVSANEIRIGRCLQFTIRLLSSEAWLRGSPWYDSNPLPESVAFPDPMPEMIFDGPAFCD
jgi:hypothetical protein